MTLIDSNNLPTHIGIIMDGNGRWAESQKMERIAGHIQGVETVKEIVDATNKMLAANIKHINEDIFQEHLYAPKTPDPDLIIRTGGENRLSNFLLWQSAYSEIHISEKNCPEFGEDDLTSALYDFSSRTRKYGRVLEKNEN